MTTPAPPAETETVLARRFRMDVDTGSGTTTWSWLPGINDFAPKVDPTTQPDTTYDDDGWGSDAVTELKWSIELTMLRRAHPTTHAFNAAQEKLRTASAEFGDASRVHVRWYDREGRPEAYEGYALVKWERDGTATDDLESIKVTLTGKGKRTAITNPLAPAGG
ncbi:phage tail tube protein [Streptomyces longwoodensis]|uniref:phage tail tube protein n=1 Tax=Streptomyces longwoodensis TaxID=68231 RepID=UPI0036F5AE63